MKRQKVRKGLIIISFLLLPLTLYYFSPDLIIEGAFEGIVTGSFIIFGVLFLSSLIFGRAFCGWICPVGGLQECMMLASDKKAKGKKGNLIKYFIWTPWIFLIITGAIAAEGLKNIDFFFRTAHGVSVSDIHALIIYFIVISVIVIMALTAGKRSFCHYVCWIAPFMIIGTKIKNILKYPSLLLKADSEKCVQCKLCTKKCPMSLEVDGMVQKKEMKNTECILCGECVDNCPKGVIKYKLKD